MASVVVKASRAASSDRTRAAIIEAAARVLGDDASARLDDVAVSAGVSRATVYRYFASREELIAALFHAAYQEVVWRITDAGIDDVPFPEALARVARACALTGDHFVVLHNGDLPAPTTPIHPDEDFEAMKDQLFERGKAEGYLRSDLPTRWLRQVFAAIVVEALRYAPVAGLGSEETAALIVEQLLAGASPRS